MATGTTGGGTTGCGGAPGIHESARRDARRARATAASTARPAGFQRRIVPNPVGPRGPVAPPPDGIHAKAAVQVADAIAAAEGGQKVGLGPLVDIYLSAGTNEGYGPAAPGGGGGWDPNAYFSCNRDEVRNCEIWRVRLRLGWSTPHEVERVVPALPHDGMLAGASMPALSPDGRYLALRRQNFSDVNAATIKAGEWTAVTVFDLERRTEVVVDEGTHPADALRFPAWYDERTLLYNRGPTTNPNKYKRNLTGNLYRADFRPAGIGVIQRGAVMGPNSTVYTGISFNNPQSKPRASTGGPSIAAHLGRLATFGEAIEGGGRPCGGTTLPVPHVHTLAGAGGARGGQFECFDLGSNRKHLNVKSCQHPSWSLDGRSIYCWQENPGDRLWSDGTANPQLLLQTTYQYQQEATGRWTATSRKGAFEELSPSALAAQFPKLFPTMGGGHLGGPKCFVTAYKHVSECASEHFIVVTIFCSDSSYNRYSDKSDVFSSRVMVIRKYPVRYWDITAMIEDHVGAGRGDWHGIYSTCRGVGGAM